MKFIGPSRLSKKARDKFRELAPGFLLNSPLMIETLAQYCELWEKYVRAEDELKASQSISLKDGLAEHGAMKTQFKCLDSMRRLMNTLQANGKPVEVKREGSLLDRLKM